jgi:methylenetetrahydrofolate reductase (NADPH)
LKPEFVDVTWSAGGSSSEASLEVASTAQNIYGYETCLHLTCTNMPKECIDDALKQAKESNIRNILALRGDPPDGDTNRVATEGQFSYAIDLVKYIRQSYGDFFCIGVAAYPEGHPENTDTLELQHLKNKIDAGADFIITQLFFDADNFMQWLQSVRDFGGRFWELTTGIEVPILPGIMLIQSFTGFKRLVSLCQVNVPSHISEALETIKEDDQAVKDYGIYLMTNLCQRLINKGLLGFHFFTLNLERSVRIILEELAFANKFRLYDDPVNSNENSSWQSPSKLVSAKNRNWDEVD